MNTARTACNGLTSADRALIARALKLAALDSRGLREHTRVQDPALALADAFGEAQHLLRELAAIAGRGDR